MKEAETLIHIDQMLILVPQHLLHNTDNIRLPCIVTSINSPHLTRVSRWDAVSHCVGSAILEADW